MDEAYPKPSPQELAVINDAIKSVQEAAGVTNQVVEVLLAFNQVPDVAWALEQGVTAYNQSRTAITEAVGHLGTAQKILETIAAPLVQAAQTTNEFLRQIGETVDRTLKEFNEAFTHLSVTVRFWGVMLELGWPPPKGLPMATMNTILRTYAVDGEDRARQAADQAMLEHYDSEHVAAMAETWKENPLMARRLPVLNDAIRAHLEGRYTLSVPVLLAQMEGLVADGSHRHGHMSIKVYKDHITELLASKDEAGPSDPIAKEFFLTIILASFKHGEPLPVGGLSRHAILHGADTGYGTAMNSLKAIMMFHYLQEAFETPNSSSSNQVARTPRVTLIPFRST